MNLAHLLARAGHSFAERPAIGHGERVLADHATLAAQAAALAAALRGPLRLAPGERVALLMRNAPEYLVVLFGAWYAGLAAVPVNARLHPRELAWILADSGARACFATPDLAHAAATAAGDCEQPPRVLETGSAEWHVLLGGAPLAHPADIAPDALAWLFYTSGTTGRPKGAMLSHRNLLAMTSGYFSDVDVIAPGDCIIHCAPMSHGSGLYALPHMARAVAQVVPDSGGFDPAETLDLIARWPGATLFFAPTMVKRLITAPGFTRTDAAKLKTIVYGGGPMYVADLLEAMHALGPRLAQIYGQGEAPMSITALDKAAHAALHGARERDPRALARLGSVGIARSDVEVRVVDADDRPLAPGQVGEVVCRGDVVMHGYWNNPDASARTLRGGWLHTGDMGSLDEAGYLTLKDRSKDLIISGGANIYPREVEEALLGDPRVLEVSVVGATHPDWGEEVVAFVVAHGGADIPVAELDALCLSRIARYKRPRRYLFVDALPKNSYGKVLKTALRERLRAAP